MDRVDEIDVKMAEIDIEDEENKELIFEENVTTREAVNFHDTNSVELRIFLTVFGGK